MTQNRVKIAVPIYRSRLEPLELKSLRNNREVLKQWPFVFLLPEGLEAPEICCSGEILRVSDEWLGTKNGIAGYNRMMMSRAFYDLFADTEYLLICQNDVWLFRDELEEWCSRGYDYVGAPWVKRAVYDYPLIRPYLALRRRFLSDRSKLLHQSLFDKVGNGGLSLRKVEPFRLACTKYAAEIDHFIRQEGSLYNEDVFWALVPKEFRYPSVEEALRFAFDTNPAYCYRMTGGQLPFGCHSWSKPRYLKFWKRFIAE